MPLFAALRYAAAMILIIGPFWAMGANISGTVKDASGSPIQDVRIDHAAGRAVVVLRGVADEAAPDEIRTDSKGHFHVVTDVPAFVIRKPGCESQRLRVTGDAELQIGLTRIRTTSRCKLSAPPAFKTKDANDIDYTAKWFYIETKDGPQGIISGRGPMYSRGAPDNQTVWMAVEYTEYMDENGVIDASGRSADGKYWRLRTAFGAASQYYNQTRETAKQLDCVMDHVPRP